MLKYLAVALFCGQLFAQQTAHECPAKCACAAHLITCTFKYLSQRTQEDVEIHPAYWNLSHSQITHLGQDTFRLGGHFQESFILDLSDNQISYVSNLAFSHMKNMRQLLLTSNNITDIGFKHMHVHNLRSLDLSYNPHLKLPEHGFELRNLESLQMAGCGLTHIPSKFFSHMENIQVLHLEKNKLTHLAAGTVVHLSLAFVDLSDNNLTIFPSELIYHLRTHTYIKLDNNPIRCKCTVHHSFNIYSRNTSSGVLHCHLYDDTNVTTQLSFHDYFEHHCDLHLNNHARSLSANTGQAAQRTYNTGEAIQENSLLNQSQSSLLPTSYTAWLVGFMAILFIIISVTVCFILKKNLKFREPNPQRFSILIANDDV